MHLFPFLATLRLQAAQVPTTGGGRRVMAHGSAEVVTFLGKVAVHDSFAMMAAEPSTAQFNPVVGHLMKHPLWGRLAVAYGHLDMDDVSPCSMLLLGLCGQTYVAEPGCSTASHCRASMPPSRSAQCSC